MTSPYLPTALSSPVLNPATGSSGANPFPYISVSEYQYAPTAIGIPSLKPGGSSADQTQVLFDTIRRASHWADTICFGADPAAKGVSLAASLSVESTWTTIKTGELRLMCDYKPILELVGCDVGIDPTTVSSIGSLAASARFTRRTIHVPYYGFPFRSGDTTPSSPIPNASTYGRIYAVWSYVNGYPHTQLVDSVTAGATSCVVSSTDGNGGLWGVYPASGAFPGTELTVYDGANTETVYVQAITTGTTTTTLTTSAFRNAHTLPTAPDFLPVSAVPADVHQAVISLTTMLIKTRGARAMVMPSVGGQPSKQALAQAGVLEDWQIADMLLTPYKVRMKRSE